MTSLALFRPASEMVQKNAALVLNESKAYLQARDALLADRKDGAIRHFWRGEGGKETADPGQDSRDAPDISGLWVILDTTPEGRGRDWYPRLD